MHPKYGDFSWMKFLPTKPHAQYAYPDALKIYDRTFGIKSWFNKYVCADHDYSQMNDKTCCVIESNMSYLHTDISFNDTMRWLKQIATTGWEQWAIEWDNSVSLWILNRAKPGNFSYIQDKGIRDEYRMLYFMLRKEPKLWEIFRTVNFTGPDNSPFVNFQELLSIGWERWYDNQITTIFSQGQKRVKISHIEYSFSCVSCFGYLQA